MDRGATGRGHRPFSTTERSVAAPLMKRIRNKLKREAIKHWPRRLLGDKHLRAHYSQFGEDIIVSTLFDRHYRGFYVDVGAHHPRSLSNTYLLWLRNWTGINIDPSPEALAAFRRARPSDVTVCCAVGGQEGKATLYRYRFSSLDTISAEAAAPDSGRGDPTSTVEVAVRTLNDILASHSCPRIDYLNVDVEGLDYDVLAGFDFARYEPKVVSIEIIDLDFDRLADHPIYALMRRQGYELISYCLMTAIFRRVPN